MMSDQKRANLITVDGSKKTKQKVTKTIRISLDLFESNEKECPEFNYKELVRAEEGRRRAEKEKKGGVPNGLRDPFSDNDEDVERIAKQFEQKYGGSSTYGRSKGRCKQDDYADIGAGYDENDSFIDNTDGYDEMIPPECDTVCGGFYINSGSLEFKNITGVGADLGDSSPPSHRKTHKRALSSSESEEESSSSDDDSDASTGEKQEEGDARNGKSNQVTDSDKSGEDGKKTKPAKAKEAEEKDGLPRKKRKNSQDEVGANQEPASASSTVKKTVKELLAEARANVGMDNNVEASTDSRSSDSSCKAPAVPSSDNPISSDSSRDAVPAAPPTASAPAAPPLPPLPPELPLEAATLARRLKALADAHFSSHTGKLSGSEVNEIILGMEKHCRRGTVPPSVRHALFSHAAALLRRGKPGLIQRARRLADEHQRTTITRMPLNRLKEIIEKMQTALLDNYRTESQRIIETNKQIVFQNLTLDDDKKIPEKRLPKRRFPWNDQVRAILSELVKSHGVSEDEEAMSRFLQSIVLPLFPSGFVRMPTLLQQAKLGKTPKSLNDSGKSKMQNKSMESKQTTNNQQSSFTKSSNKTAIDPTKFSQPTERGISDPESMVPVQPRPRPPTSSICVGTDVKDTDAKTESNHNRNDHSPNQLSLDPEKNKSFKVHSDGRSASPMIGDNVSISVTSVFQKKNEAEKSSPSPPKTDKYVHPNSNSSLTITPVTSTHKDSSKLSQPPVKVSNSVTITANPLVKPGDINSTTGPATQPSISPGSIKVKSANALFDKNTIAKIISGKNTHDSAGKVDSGKDAHRMKSYPDHHNKSGDKTSKLPHISTGIDLMKPNILPASPLPMLTKTYLGASEPKLSNEDYKSSHSNNDMFVKPKYKTDHTSHHQRSSNNSLPMSQPNYHKSLDVKNTDINKYQNDVHKSPHSERNTDSLNLSPVSKHLDHLPTPSSTPHPSSYVLKQHRIQKKYDSLQPGMLAGPNNQKEGSSQQKLNFGDNLPFSKSGGHKADVLNVDDSSSDDCVEIVAEDGPSTNKPVTSVLRDDDAKRREIIRQEVEKQYKMLHDKPFERTKNDFSIKNIVKENAYSVKNILKSSHATEHDIKKHNVESNPQSVIHSKTDSVLKYPSTRKTPDPEGEPEPKKYKLDSLGDSEPFQRLEGRTPQIFSTTSDNIKCEPVSVIKDNFMSKSDRFTDRIHETSGNELNAAFEEKESAMEQELDVNTVMQDIKSLQDFQMCSSDALHQRQFDDASNKIFRAGPYPSENNPAIFNNKNFVSNENLLKKQSHFMETPSSHNLTTGSLH